MADGSLDSKISESRIRGDADPEVSLPVLAPADAPTNCEPAT
jgi:hypothetical protein